MMRIPFELAETVATVVDEGTFDAAARALHVTPSAVSQRIRTLEEQLGRVVLVRSKPVRTTPAGDAVVRLARQARLLEHDAAAALGEPDGGDGTRVEVPVAVNADSLATWLLPPLVRAAERHPVVFDIHRADQDLTAALLEAGTVMAAVTSRPDPVAGCRVTALGSMRYVAVSSATFAATWFGGEVTRHALEQAPLVDFDRSDDLQTRWLRAAGADPAQAPRHRVPASHDFAQAVALGLGWALLPTLQAESGLADGSLVALGGDPVDVALHWQRWNLRSPVLEAVSAEVVVAAAGALLPAGAVPAGD